MTFKTMVARLRKGLYIIAAIGLPAAAAAQSVPDVIGPIPANLPPGTDLTHNYPQLSSEPTDNLSSRGYVEEEFFFQGAATSYATPALDDGVVVFTGHPYESRMIVRRPADPSSFNGVVLVEWVNVTSGYNLDLHWQASREYLTRHGYAYVGVSAQRVGVQQAPYGLTEWSPTRRVLPVELVRIDIRKLARAQQLVDLGRMALADQSDAVDAALDQSADLPRFLRLVIVAGSDEKLVAEFLQASLQRRDASREDSDPERRYNVADGEGMARGQRSRSPVPDIAEFAHRAHNTFADLWAHLRRIIEDA